MSEAAQVALLQELLDVSHVNRCNAAIRNGLPDAPSRNKVGTNQEAFFDVLTTKLSSTKTEQPATATPPLTVSPIATPAAVPVASPVVVETKNEAVKATAATPSTPIAIQESKLKSNVAKWVGPALAGLGIAGASAGGYMFGNRGDSTKTIEKTIVQPGDKQSGGNWLDWLDKAGDNLPPSGAAKK